MDQHKISFWTAVLMNVNVMVCSAIFVMPTLMAQKAGYASVFGWPLVALIMMPIVFCTATMARIFPGAGAFYAYCKNILGPAAGFMSGWAFYLGYTGVVAVLVNFLRDNILSPILPVAIPAVLFNAVFVGLIMLLSLPSITVIGRIQSIGTIFKILPLVFVMGVFLAYWNPAFSITLSGLASVPATVPFVLFGFWGFETCCTISHLIKGDKNNASLAMLTAFGFVSILYTLFHFGVLHIMGAENLAAAASARAFVFYLGLSPLLEACFNSFISVILIIVFVNAIYSIFVAVSSVLHTMAGRNVFPYTQSLLKVNKNQRPWVAIVLQGLLTFLITCLIADKTVLVGMINFGILIAFLLVIVALYVLQKRTEQRKHMWITIAALCSWLFLAYFGWMDKDLGATHIAKIIAMVPLIIAFAAGYGMYAYKQREHSPSEHSPTHGMYQK